MSGEGWSGSPGAHPLDHPVLHPGQSPGGSIHLPG